ncbi:MAG: hypothetical protein GF353_27940 [Candidatus Lokiarchaeota archaeon]|nr:hypothetical protein [Candidatus Lokiarchaeota archaeon]
MVFSELKKLFTEKEYRLFLILTLWLIIGFTLFQFSDIIPYQVSLAFYPPLLGICIALFVASAVLRIELRKANYKTILIIVVIAVLISIFFSALWTMLYVGLYIIAVFSYIFITAVFYMYSCYKYGTDWDQDLKDLKTPLNKILRWFVFLGGTVLSLVIIFVLMRIAMIAFYIFVIMIALAILGVLTLIKGKFNAWLGTFFLWVALYSVYLILSVFMALGQQNSDQGLLINIGFYVFDLFMIIYVIASIIGVKTEVLSKQFKFLKPDAILVWLIFSKAAFELGKALYEISPSGISLMNISVVNSILGYVLFIPLFLIAGIYGIYKFSVRKDDEDEKKIENSN